MFQKVACQQLHLTMEDICVFIKLTNPIQSPSVIHYMELINENLDSEETMLHFAEDLFRLIHSKNGLLRWKNIHSSLQHQTALWNTIK